VLGAHSPRQIWHAALDAPLAAAEATLMVVAARGIEKLNYPRLLKLTPIRLDII
jgi:hypothetical protein